MLSQDLPIQQDQKYARPALATPFFEASKRVSILQHLKAAK